MLGAKNENHRKKKKINEVESSLESKFNEIKDELEAKLKKLSGIQFKITVEKKKMDIYISDEKCCQNGGFGLFLSILRVLILHSIFYDMLILGIRVNWYNKWIQS